VVSNVCIEVEVMDMGDKSPKDARKKTTQKQVKADTVAQKKRDAEAAKQGGGQRS
jgi:hypothetical protein